MPRDPRGQLVEEEFLTLPIWDQFDPVAAEAVARSVERCLPEPWKFSRVARHKGGDQKRQVAFFDFNGNEFALIPGGDVTLGYDPKRPQPPKRMLDEWYEAAREMAEHYPEWRTMTWERYLAGVLSPLRQVRFGPFLIAVRGVPRAAKTGKAERGSIKKEKFALPTADQWEYACSAGSRSVWYWGDNPTGGPPKSNAFGLVIVQNSYHQDVLDERDHFRGGDGGRREHGGCCRLESFVPLSSWFGARGVNATQEDWWEPTFYRRVFPLPDEMLG